MINDTESYRLLVQEKMRAAINTPEFREQLITELSEDDFLAALQSSMTSVAKRLSLWARMIRSIADIKYVILATVVFGTILLLPTPDGLPVQGHRALAVFALTVILWVSEAIPLPIASLLACTLFSLLGVIPHKDAFLGYGSHTVYFLIGALLLGTAIIKVNVHKRISLLVLTRFGTSTSMMLFGVTVLGAFLSLLMPEHAVGAMLFPILLSIIAAANVVPGESNFARALILSFAYGASAGSMGSLLGGARNPLAISIYKEYTGNSVSFLGWMGMTLPLTIVMVAIIFLVIRKVFPIEDVDLNAARKSMRNEIKMLGPIGWPERKVIGIFITAFLLWAILGETIGLAVVAIGVALMLFAAKSLVWEDLEKGIPWRIIFLYGGAVTISRALTTTGAAKYIGEHCLSLAGGNPYIILFVLVVVTKCLTELMSNVGATGIILPIALSAMSATGFPPIIAMYAVGMSSALAFMLPVGTPNNALAYSTGCVTIKDMIRGGSWLNLLSILVFMTIGLGYWKLIGLF